MVNGNPQLSVIPSFGLRLSQKWKALMFVCPADHCIDSRCYHSVIEGPEQCPAYSEGPQSPHQGDEKSFGQCWLFYAFTFFASVDLYFPKTTILKKLRNHRCF